MAAAPPMVPSAARLVSRYGERPSRRDGSPHFHGGLDISTGHTGDPVFAIKDGTVELIGENLNPRGLTGYGNAVVIRHGDGKRSLYAHLTAALVTVGQAVRAGQQIGTMGNTTNGAFSPLPGQDVDAWRREARARGYRSGPMAPHVHIEIRRPRSDGSAPWPGPYPRSAEDVGSGSLDPQQWFREHGMIFTRRGGIEIQPGGAADRSRASWEPTMNAMAGTLSIMGLSGDQIDALGQIRSGTYEPVEFERDAKWGITKTEWGMLAAGGIVLTAGVAAMIIRSRMSPNRRRSGPRKNRLRTWGSK